MIKSDDQDKKVVTGCFSFVCLPFLYFVVILFEMPYLFVVPIAFTIFWVDFLVKRNKDYKLMQLQNLIVEIDEDTLTRSTLRKVGN